MRLLVSFKAVIGTHIVYKIDIYMLIGIIALIDRPEACLQAVLGIVYRNDEHNIRPYLRDIVVGMLHLAPLIKKDEEGAYRRNNLDSKRNDYPAYPIEERIEHMSEKIIHFAVLSPGFLE